MTEYLTRKLCAIRTKSGRGPSIYPAGMIVEIHDEDAIAALIELGAIEEVADPDAEAVDAPAPEGNGDGDIDVDEFVEWVAGGAKVGEVIEWVGEDLDRAEIASEDKRPTVQKHIDGLLETVDSEPVIEPTNVDTVVTDESNDTALD